MKKVNEWNIIWFDLYERSEKRDKNQFVKMKYAIINLCKEFSTKSTRSRERFISLEANITQITVRKM